jgi:hypothetical protein
MRSFAEKLLENARQQTGLSDFGDDWFMASLEAYLSGLEGPQISEFGKQFLARQAVKDLSRRLAIIDCLKKNPEIEDTPIPPILYITGHERSGTTLLHNLLALHDKARFLSRWELMLPTPPPEVASYKEDPRRQVVKNSIDALRGTDLEKMHWVEAEDPEECVWGFMDCIGIVGMAPSLILPPWHEWLANADLTPCFTNYRKIIQLLTWKNPVTEDGFLVLKAPQMASHLENFSRVFPEAKFLYLHRDPYRVLSSFCTLIDIVNGPFLTDQNYQEKMDLQQSLCLKRMGQVYTKMAEFENSQPERVGNIQYVDLLNAPVEEIARVYRAAGLQSDTALEQKIQEFLARQKAGGRARPRQQMSDHGYTRQQVENNPDLHSYLQRYKVMLEQNRNTGVI